MASGSMCAVLYPELQALVRNQVHLIEFMVDDIRLKGIRGTFRSWDWAPSIGWVPAGDRSGLPHAGGFGHREQPAQVAENIISCIKEVSIEWNELLLIEPNIRYLTPADWELVKAELRRHSVKVLEADGQILRLERTE